MSPNAKRPLSAQMVLLVCLLSTDLSRRLSHLLYNALDILTRSPEKISHVEKFFFRKTKYVKCLVGELPYYYLFEDLHLDQYLTLPNNILDAESKHI